MKPMRSSEYGEAPALPRPIAGTPPRPPATNDLIAMKHFATGVWLGPYRIVEIKTAPDGREELATTRHDGSGGWIVVGNGYGNGDNQWRYASEVDIWTKSDHKIVALLRSLDGEPWRKLADWVAYGVAQ